MPRLRLLRLAVAFSVLCPLVLAAQGGAPRPAPGVTPAGGSAVLPFTGEGWQDKVLTHAGYVMPPRELSDAVLAPRHLNLSLANPSPDKQWFLEEVGDGPVPMSVFSKPFHELGGVFIDYQASRARALTIRNAAGLQIISAADGSSKSIQMPAGARVSNAIWSPDGKSVAFYVHTPDATHIWLGDAATGLSRQLTVQPVLATLITAFEFTDDGRHIAVVVVPDARPAMPPPVPAAPSGPEIKIASGTRASLRTFPSLMSTPHDFDLLEWHATGQVVLIDVASRAIKKVGTPTMVRSVDASPDGRFVRVSRMTRPFSNIVPVNNFGTVDEVWEADGKVLAKLSERPINLGAVPDDPAPTDPAAPPAAGGGRGAANQAGKREIAWRPDGQGLTYAEQEPASASAPASAGATAGPAPAGGRAGGRGAGAQQAPRKDRVYQWLPPFDAAGAKVIYENNTRLTGHRYSPDAKLLFFSETAGQTTTDYAVDLTNVAQRYPLNSSRAAGGADPPSPATLISSRGTWTGAGRATGAAGGGGRGGGASPPVLISSDGSSVFYAGAVYDRNPQAVGPKTFLDKVVIKTGEKTRVFESSNQDVYERVTTLLDRDATRFVISREGPTLVPQQMLVNGPSRKQLTNNEDITPDLTRAPRHTVEVTRPDGFRFDLSVLLPPGYQPGTRLPAIFWIYPSEYDGQDAYDRPDRTFNRNAFPNFGVRSMQFFARLGYAVITDTTGRSGTAGVPIVGPAGRQNDNYVNDLRNDLTAAIDELDRRGFIDRTRLAIGGHSYGAFSTVNAMVSTPFFKAGIAGDGAYNRTLTPFGFQNERRTLWQAPNVYFEMSPFLHADHMTGALLLYHGLADQNVGTDPINSERLFQALNELGKTAAMYRYPLEDHGPASRETLLDLWARWAAWLDKHVKSAGQPVVKPVPGGQPR